MYRILALVGLLLFTFQSPMKSEVPFPARESHLRLFHTHTGEHIDVVFRRDETYVASALDALKARRGSCAVVRGTQIKKSAP